MILRSVPYRIVLKYLVFKKKLSCFIFMPEYANAEQIRSLHTKLRESLIVEIQDIQQFSCWGVVALRKSAERYGWVPINFLKVIFKAPLIILFHFIMYFNRFRRGAFINYFLSPLKSTSPFKARNSNVIEKEALINSVWHKEISCK